MPDFASALCAKLLRTLLPESDYNLATSYKGNKMLNHIDSLPGMSGDPSLPEASSPPQPIPPRVWKTAHENDNKSKYGHRDLVGYGKIPVNPQWPKGAKVALNFVINYEEGGENCLLHGDGQSEHLLSDIIGATPMGKSFLIFLFSAKAKGKCLTASN